MPALGRGRGTGGAPFGRRSYNSLIRATPGLVTYWAGQMGNLTTSINNYTMPTGAFSMECWVRITSVAGNVGLWAQWNSVGPMIWVDATFARYMFHVNSSDIDSGVAPTANRWQHVVGTYDGTSRAIYVDGSLKGGPTSGVTPSAATSPLLFGNYTGSGNGGLTGTGADGAIYNRALTPAEVSRHYIAGILQYA